MVTCHIVGADCPIQANYGAMRGNDCQAEGVQKPFVHELVFILEGLTKQFGKEKAIEAVDRYGKSLAFGYDEMSAIRKIGAWSVECITSLATIFNKFQCLQTLDGKSIGKRQSRRIMSGNIIEVPKVLLKKVCKVESDFILQKAHLVLENKVSLKFLVDEFFKIPKRTLTASVVMEMSGLKDFTMLNETFPGKFGDSVLDKYEGAVIGENANSVGEALQKYCYKVFEDKVAEPEAKFYELESFSVADFSKWTKYDLIVLSCDMINDENILQLQTLKGLKNQMSILILFGDQEEGIKTYSNLARAYDSFDPKLTFFKLEEADAGGDFCENVKLGILLAGNIYKPPVCALNGDLAQLVSKLVPPGSGIAFAFEENPKLVRLHTGSSCDYFGSKVALLEFKKVLGCDMDVVIAQEEGDMITNEDGSDKNDVSAAGPSGVCNSTLTEGVMHPTNESLNISDISAQCVGEKCSQSDDD